MCFASVYISILVNEFPLIDPIYFFLSIAILFVINIFTNLSQIIIFHTFSFCWMLFLFPLLNSYSISFFPTINLLSIFLSSIFLNIIFSRVFFDISSKKGLLLGCFFGSIIFIMFHKFTPFSWVFGHLIVFCTSFLILSLCCRNLLFYNKISNINAIILAVLILMLPFLSLFKYPNVESKVALLESKWCSTTADFKNDYSIKSAYSYSIMKDILSKGSFKWLQKYSQIEETLNQIDTLIMLTPTKPFDQKQIIAIERFVAEGGTLVAVADHTDLYGHALVLNEVLKPFDIKINNVALFKEDSHEETIRVNGHELINIKTPSTVSVFRFFNVWAWANGWISEKGDYSTPNFFGELSWTSDDAVGNWPVGVTVKHHLGQVVVFCDSTIFANFAIFQPEYISLLFRIVFSNKILSNLHFYGSILFILIVFFYYFYKFKSSFSLIVSVSLVVFTGSYFMENPFDLNKFLPNHINVYSSKQLIQEMPPTRMPSENGFSTAYANIARSGIFPIYSGENPPPSTDRSYILISSYEDFINKHINLINENAKIIITNLMPEGNIFDFKRNQYNYQIAQELNNFLQIMPAERRFYSKDNNYTLTYHNSSVLASFGILNDRFIGNWWVEGEISPFRRYILESFYDWVRNGADIKVFDYPPIGVSNFKTAKNKWLIKTNQGDSISMSFKVNFDQSGMVYCGSGFWAIHDKKNNKQYLLGGPELSDDLFSTSIIRWAAVKLIE